MSPIAYRRAEPRQLTPGKHQHTFYQQSAVIPLYASSEPVRGRASMRSALKTLRRIASAERMGDMRKSRSMDFRSDSKQGSSSASGSSGVSVSSASSSSSPTSPASPLKTFNFDFELPQPDKPGDELPPTFSASNILSGGVRGRAYAENADVQYRVVALWESLDGSGTTRRCVIAFPFGCLATRSSDSG